MGGARLLFRIHRPYRAPAPFVAAWLQGSHDDDASQRVGAWVQDHAPDGAAPAPLAWTARYGSIEARHSVAPEGADASVLHVEATTTNRALSVLGPLVKLAMLPRAHRLARACAREWRARAATSG